MRNPDTDHSVRVIHGKSRCGDTEGSRQLRKPLTKTFPPDMSVIFEDCIQLSFRIESHQFQIAIHILQRNLFPVMKLKIRDQIIRIRHPPCEFVTNDWQKLLMKFVRSAWM